ncbi:hypothetical protein C8R43DRAFT_41971 [Mycena crocata]|nr:hypothetical protein C8R43DRAFT_41971 [Mycena crocata]
MVHRPADSWFLANLLLQEKESAKHRATLLDCLDHSNLLRWLLSLHTYLYISTGLCPPLPIAFVGYLVAADDALRLYAVVVSVGGSRGRSWK